MRTKEEIQEEINELEEMKEAIELQEDKDFLEEYREMLDETMQDWIKYYYGGMVLEEIDPTAYSCGYNDYADSRLTELENEIEDLRQELEEAEE